VIGLLLARLGPYVILSALVIGAGYLAGEWIKEKGRAELRPEIERLEATLATERVDRARAERATASYQSEMELLRNRTVNSAVNRTPVRLCVTAPVPPSGAAAQGANDSSPESGGHDRAARANPAPGPDIGADLYALAFACDAEIAKLRALQGWANGLD